MGRGASGLDGWMVGAGTLVGGKTHWICILFSLGQLIWGRGRESQMQRSFGRGEVINFGVGRGKAAGLEFEFEKRDDEGTEEWIFGVTKV